MSQQLVVGKYKFYPYEIDKGRTPTSDDLKELLGKLTAKNEKDVKTPSRSLDRCRPRRKRRG